MVNDSRISGLYRLSIPERIAALEERGFLSTGDAELLRQGRFVLRPEIADRMTENVVGVFGLPFSIAPNFVVNGGETLVPMVVEEPSVVAAVSMASLLARKTGGFTSRCDESLLIGQVHVSDVADVDAALARVADAAEELIASCNDVHPRLVARGGGVASIDARGLTLGTGSDVIAVHILVDTCDAMGANLVNTICEAIAPRIGELCQGNVALRILSNLADRSLVTARVRYEIADDVRDGIVLASDIAQADPYRAATHNKGIMNGIDALAIATGNDWRAVEAGAHVYAARDGQYRPLATWCVGDNGELVGELVMPIKVGTAGGSVGANPGARAGLELAGISTAVELAELMGAVGLAQNFAALRALATSGIQEGHMKLHARKGTGSLDRQEWAVDVESADGVACGKAILLGEHAVVYGRRALALPIREAVAVTLSTDAAGAVDREFEPAITLIKEKLGVVDANVSVQIRSRLPLAMGLGSSAAYAVAVARAFNARLELGLDDDAINAIAFECEKLAHGTPSGIDNTIATYGEPMLFQNDGGLHVENLDIAEPLPLVVACSHQRGHTKDVVAGVRERRDQDPGHYDAIFDQMDALSQAGADALVAGRHDELGRLMNISQGLLNAIGVSTAELEGMIAIARAAGAVGAKLTGAGGGGSIVALCPGAVGEVTAALERAGFRTIEMN